MSNFNQFNQEKNMKEKLDLEAWGKMIGKLVEEKRHEVKKKVIENSVFLTFLDNEEEWEKEPVSLDKIDSYYRQKEIQPNVINPHLMYSLISGEDGYKFAETWIKSEMIDKSCLWFAKRGIDKFFISEICNESGYSDQEIIKKEEKELQNPIKLLEWIKEVINSFTEKRVDKKNLVLVIGEKYDMSLRLSPHHHEYNELKNFLGKVVEVNQEFKKNFVFALVNRKDLKFRWIFWGLKWDYNIFNLYTYILLHAWYNVEKDKNFSSNASIYLKEL
jgi:hypothetical protein